MTEKADLAQVMAIEPVILAAAGQGPAGHIQIDHLGRAAGQSGHREAAGVGEQIEDAQAGGLLAHPAAAQAHVEEQPHVLVAGEVQAELQAVLVDDVLAHRRADQRLAGRIQAIAMLQQQAAGTAGHPHRGLAQGGQGGAQGVQLGRGQFAKQPHPHHAFQPIDGKLLQPRQQPAAAMDQPARLGGWLIEGDQEQVSETGKGGGIHGRSRRQRSGMLRQKRRPRLPQRAR